VAQLVKRLIDYDLFGVMLWDEEAQLLRHRFTLRQGERLVDKSDHALGYGISGTAAALRQPVRVPNVHLDPRYVSCWMGEEARSELAVPLVFKDRLIGVIDLESTRYNAFSEHHEQMLSTLGSYVAIALENARLYAKVVKDESRLESAYESARHVGGDIYDFLPYGDGRVAVAVGDVAGKGAAAALYGSLAIGILRGHVVEHPCEPAEMLLEMNRHLLQPRAQGRFVTLSFAVYDTASRMLTLANAGFTRPRLLRRGRVEEIKIDGVPLGLLPDIQYEQKKLALQVGDLVVFCSDGIHECVNREDEEFGSERLEALLLELADGSAQKIAMGVLRATDRYADGTASMHDDRTVVVLRVTPK
jgi:sigma-B regulation protein RsbU (phosphoserine phosphatase)